MTTPAPVNETLFDRAPDLRWLHLANALLYAGHEGLANFALLALYLRAPFANPEVN